MNNVNERELDRANSGTWDSKEKQIEPAPNNGNSPKKMISFKSADKPRSSSKHSGKSSGKQKYRGSNDYQDEGRLNQTAKHARSSLRAISPDQFNATMKTPGLRTPKKDSLTPMTGK